MENLLLYKSAYKKCWLEAFIDCTYYYQIFTFFDERLNNCSCCALHFHWITKHDGQFSWVNWDFCRTILFKCAVCVNHNPLSMTILMLNGTWGLRCVLVKCSNNSSNHFYWCKPKWDTLFFFFWSAMGELCWSCNTTFVKALISCNEEKVCGSFLLRTTLDIYTK